MNRGDTLRLWLRPGLLGLHAFAVVSIVFCVVMGLWQLGAYDNRQEHERADKQTVPTVALSGLWGPDEPFTGRLNQRPVTVEGRFAPAEEQVWVTDRRSGDRTGVWLLAPVLVDGDDHALLVVRGWAPEPSSLPPVPSGTTTFEAVLQQGEPSLGAFEPQTREIASVRVPTLTNELPYDLYSGYAIATSADVAGGLELADAPLADDVSWTVGLRNLAYAVQWWVFGAFALFMWWRMSTESVAAARAKVA